MNLSTTTDLSEFLLLPATVRQEVESWHKQLCTVSRPIHAALSRIAAELGVSAKTARRKYDAWRHAGGPSDTAWRALINRARIPEARGLDPDFIEYWRGLCEKNGRKCKPAYREFVRQYRSGQPIPGVPHVRDGIPRLRDGVPHGTSGNGRDAFHPRPHLPKGFSYDNLVRYKPTAFELTAARIGRSAAAPFRPKVLTTRVGLHVGERYIFDDLWHDFKVVMVGQRRPMRLLQLHAHDLYSGCQFARGLKPRVEDPESGKSVNLQQDEMLFLLAHVLTEFGYYPSSCALMVEHGTAAIAEVLERMLYDLTAGRVTVERSGIEGASAFAGQYPGRGKGNFRFKAALESLGNLIHNETANLLQFPGQTGSNSRINAPEEMAGRERLTDQLSMAMVALPSQVAMRLRLPYLEVNAAKWLVEEVMERINQRTDHELEGWLEAGHTTVDFEVPGVGLIQGAQYLGLSPERRAAIDAVATPLARRLSPREVFSLGQGQLVRFRPEQTARLLLTSGNAAREVWVGQDHEITLEDQKVSPEPLRFAAHHFSPGTKFQAVVNPWSPDSLHLFDSRGAWVGVVNSWQRVSRLDQSALHAQMGRAAKIEKELLAPLAARGRDLTRQRLDAAQHNAAVLRDPLTDDQKAARTEARRHGPSAANEILESGRGVPPLAGSESDTSSGDDLLSTLTADLTPQPK